MKAKLIKTPIGLYRLIVENYDYDYGHTIPEYCEYTHKLSRKNCHAIERGYDLDELASDFLKKEWLPNTSDEDRELWYLTNDWAKEVVKIMSKFYVKLLGDKKYSEEDLRTAYFNGEKDSYVKGGQTKKMEDEYIQSLQQTEWDVEVEMESNLHIGEVADDSYPKGFPTQKPKLDADGCLILKKITNEN